MAVGAILTLGLGTFSDVNHVVTLGYGTGATAFVPAVTAQTGKGRAPKPFTFSVRIGDEYFIFGSLEEALAALESTDPKEVIEARARRDAERVVRIGRKKAKPAPPRVLVNLPAAMQGPDLVPPLQRAIERAYWNALADELAAIAEEEEDIAFIASIV